MMTTINDDPWSITTDENSGTNILEHIRFQKPEKVVINGNSVPHRGVTITFHDLSYSVKEGIARRERKILREVHGEFRAGELTAIMGPSGAGKSTLLNALAGFTSRGVTGTVLVNEQPRDMKKVRKYFRYIMQDDILPPMLNVDEAMAIAVQLQLGRRKSAFATDDRVSKILDSFGLLQCRKVLSCNLSGGQRKRLAIAVELVSDPPVMFFDEPTSGLDCYTSRQCIELLKSMAKDGRTIVCSIHQPNASLFEMMDLVYIVADGVCVYSGASKALVPFLAEFSLPCPQYHNPADFFIELASEQVSYIPKFEEAIDKGRCIKWRKIPNDECQKIEGTDFQILHDSKPNGKFKRHKTYATPFWVQTQILLKRYYIQLFRNRSFTCLQLGIHLAAAIVVGILFFDVGNKSGHRNLNFSVLFFSILFVLFTSYSAAVMFYPLELPILTREHFNKWYSLKNHYLATNMAQAPVQLLCSTLYFTVVYFMTSQPLEVNRFFISSVTISLISLTGQSFGYLIGASMSVSFAAVFGPLIICPFMLFSGFFVLLKDSPWFLSWLFHMSYFKYALHAMMQGIMGNNRPKLLCDADFCLFDSPLKFLEHFELAEGSYLIDWAFMFIIIILLRIAAYISLFVQIRMR